jgi:predicted GNAT family acetyltransferase
MSTPPGFHVETVGDIQQMVAQDFAASPSTAARLISLQNEDAADMLKLASLTKPGPFGPHTHELGEYIGVREEGQLVAMAGERMQFDGYVEISAVCVHPDHRGKGYARILLTELRHRIALRGKIPILHVFESNKGAIALYEQLGFVRRQRFVVSRLGHAHQTES